MAARSEKGLARIVQKLDASITSGQYYEAHQLYRTLYFRYLSLKKYEELLQLLHKGSTILLRHNQQGSGTDLAILLIDVLSQSETKPDVEWIENIGALFALMSSTLPERDTFLTKAIKWSMDKFQRGDPLLHRKIAEVYWKEERYPQAHKHFLKSNDGIIYGAMLIELNTTCGVRSEVDLILAQAILQILCLRNLKMAEDTFLKYTTCHPMLKDEQVPSPSKYPMINFLHFLLKAVEEKNVAQFLSLKEYYAESLERDPNYADYLKKIGNFWFGIEPTNARRNPNGMFSGLINTLLRETGSSDDEPERVRNRNYDNLITTLDLD